MKVIESELNVGASSPFRLLHISDNHLTLADDRDDERKLELAVHRSREFTNAESDLDFAEKLAEKNGDIIVHSGDLIDFVSYANLDKAKNFTDRNDCFMSAGNHEFSLYVGETKEDEAYRAQSLEKVQSAFKNDIRFSSRVICGVNLVAVDNSYYQIEQWQLERLKSEVAKNLPIILVMHTPLYNEDIFNFSIGNAPGEPAYLMSVPTERMSGYSPERFEQQLQNEATAAAFHFISQTSLIKAVLCGHLHHDFETLLFGFLPQYTVGIGTAREILVK